MCTRAGRTPLGALDVNSRCGKLSDFTAKAGMREGSVQPARPGLLPMTPSPGSPSSASSGSGLEITPAPTTPETEQRLNAEAVRGNASPLLIPKLSPTIDAHASRYLLPEQAPEHRGKFTIVFDLDETLVSNRFPGCKPAMQRPYLQYMFQLVKGLVEIVMWTASTEETGGIVVNQIDPKREFFDHVIYRNPKWFTDGSHTKDLQLLGRDLDKVLIVENTPNCCKLYPQNAVIVEDFVGSMVEPDRTLLGVAAIIRGAALRGDADLQMPVYLHEHLHMKNSALELYELGLPYSYANMTREQAYELISRLDPLYRPPLGHYYYVKKN